jgi:dTDP-4-dehydrorhamnose 3,5-epimerase
MIAGVTVTPLGQIVDERGKIMHMLRCDSARFQQFGEVYFSCVWPGVIKGWHLHKAMTLNYAVPIGHIKLALYDERADSPTHGQVQEVFLGESNYHLVTVPPGVWNGFKGVGDKMALVANCATLPHDPDEISRCDPLNNNIPYDWSLKHR